MSDISIPTSPLTEDDRALVEEARAATANAFDPDRWGGAHMVGAALRASNGRVFTGVSLPSNVGRTSMCAEPVAIGNAMGEGVRNLDAVVAVRHPLPEEDRDFEVSPPCGACRELIADYGPDVEVIVPRNDDLQKAEAIDLLPTRNW